ncbi:Zn-ribbon protein [Bifidobacterium pseudolongum subsp. globosum]|uniref:Zn-ribbon protein n=1 Tax=Bifidobacterium pseudolongum subsp. globosum TaxID=1690 RepID=A0A2N3QLF0_9BIFI|nr:hypothetical protein [Bifidobacterium pseudolongum]PKU92507.1 Zn-ribbon protein [Bifidobacterium pseudolongum subsp. globosum]
MKNDKDVENTEAAEGVCPYCGSRNIARIFRGMSTFTEELQRELDEGKVALGGCVFEYDRPILLYHCNDCEEEF